MVSHTTRPKTAPVVRPTTAKSGRSVKVMERTSNESISAAGFEGDWNKDLYLKLLSGEAEHL